MCVAFALDELQAEFSYPVGEEELKAAGSDAQRCEQPHGRQIRQENWKRGGQRKEEGGSELSASSLCNQRLDRGLA